MLFRSEALAYPGWMAIFTRHADHKHAGFNWSFFSTVVLGSTAIAGSLGGYIGETYGFRPLFLGMGVMTFLGFFTTIALALFYAELRQVKTRNLDSIRERMSKVMMRQKYPIAPPKEPSQLPK